MCFEAKMIIQYQNFTVTLLPFLALIHVFLLEKFLIPAATIKLPNIMIAAPPITDSGIAAIIPPSFGNKPNKN